MTFTRARRRWWRRRWKRQDEGSEGDVQGRVCRRRTRLKKKAPESQGALTLTRLTFERDVCLTPELDWVGRLLEAIAGSADDG